jgi:hypothetical protein
VFQFIGKTVGDDEGVSNCITINVDYDGKASLRRLSRKNSSNKKVTFSSTLPNRHVTRRKSTPPSDGFSNNNELNSPLSNSLTPQKLKHSMSPPPLSSSSWMKNKAYQMSTSPTPSSTPSSTYRGSPGICMSPSFNPSAFSSLKIIERTNRLLNLSENWNIKLPSQYLDPVDVSVLQDNIATFMSLSHVSDSEKHPVVEIEMSNTCGLSKTESEPNNKDFKIVVPKDGDVYPLKDSFFLIVGQLINRARDRLDKFFQLCCLLYSFIIVTNYC